MGCSLMKSAFFVYCVIKRIVDHAPSSTVHNLRPYGQARTQEGYAGDTSPPPDLKRR